MAPKRAARGGAATPSPAPRPSPVPNTPGRLISGRINETGKAANVRTAMPTKYSTSYGSPMSQLPNRAVIHGGGSLQQAASEVLKTVQEDHRAAVEARRQAEERRNTASVRTTILTAPTSTRASTVHESEEDELNESEQSERGSPERQAEEGPSASTSGKRRVGRPTKKAEQPKAEPAKRGNKRQRDDAEVDKQAEKERTEREERLRRERSEEARRNAEEHLARAQAAQAAAEREMAEEARLAREEAARRRAEERRVQAAKKAEHEEAARQRAEQERRVEEEAARQRAEQERRAQAAQEEAARREVEANRRALDEEAARQRAEQERRQSVAAASAAAAAVKPVRVPRIRRETSMPPPAAPHPVAAGRGSSLPPVSTPISNTAPRIPESVRSFVEESNVFGNAQLKTPKPPAPSEETILVESVTLSCPTSTEKMAKVHKQPIPPPYESESTSSSDPLTSEDNAPPPPRPINQKTTSGKTTGGKTASSKNAGSSSAPRPPAPVQKAPRPNPTQEIPRTWTEEAGIRFGETIKPPFDSWSLWKIFLSSLLILYFYRLIYSVARPDLFDRPALNIRWYGWGNWKANAGQFFPSPLLHPLGVLTETQYSDLKDFLHDESSSTADAVKSIESLLPKMVSVQKDRRRNKLIIGDDFWRALRDQIHSDDSILTLLEGKSEISEKHWKAIQNRLAKSGEIESITDKRISSSWEKWLNGNQKKVAEILGKNLHKGTAENLIHDIQDIVISREEFTKRLQPILEQNKLTASKLKELEKLVNKSRSGGYTGGGEVGISETKVREIVNKAIKTAKLEAAAKSEISRFDAELQRRVNHFGIGNGAMVDDTNSSPTWEVVKPPFGSKEWLKTMPTLPRFLIEKSAALSAWDEAGHCWCAGTQINATHSRPADLFVRLANFIIPQHVVVEHIDPSATLDPEAMPKDMEIWAHYDEYHRSTKMADFMEVHFPESRRKNPELVARGFYQIGRFRYEHKERDKGVKVERLSKELVGLKAGTDYVLVRAATNYGAKDHTCFYRVRLYGEVADVTDGERESRSWA